MNAADEIAAECDAIKEMLLAKNAAYGNSALEPIRILSKASTREQLLVRIDDKLNRMAQGSAAGEDVPRDLAGYFILLCVLERCAAEKNHDTEPPSSCADVEVALGCVCKEST